MFELPPELRQPSEVRLVECEDCLDFMVLDHICATLTKRPPYCDRGHWMVQCWLPDIDSADCFPRYYMSELTAKLETIAFLHWRLWKQSVS